MVLFVSRAGAQGFCFSTAVDYAVGSYPYGIFAVDLDGDNDVDLVVANSGGDSVSVLRSNGDGTVLAAVNYQTSRGPISVKWRGV